MCPGGGGQQGGRVGKLSWENEFGVDVVQQSDMLEGRTRLGETVG